ncbi:uncharacterized protein LOC131849974 [Achroia grisella]|uniref:uncharacterized protein LOC131849974 n=1 Tax=Achroia grisella TaxID=688607 RepID=UPI0027D2AFD9|nr:uncharacterized protein LOC131849974 [Achroia grisella]
MAKALQIFGAIAALIIKFILIMAIRQWIKTCCCNDNKSECTDEQRIEQTNGQTNETYVSTDQPTELYTKTSTPPPSYRETVKTEPTLPIVANLPTDPPNPQATDTKSIKLDIISS